MQIYHTELVCTYGQPVARGGMTDRGQRAQAVEIMTARQRDGQTATASRQTADARQGQRTADPAALTRSREKRERSKDREKSANARGAALETRPAGAREGEAAPDQQRERQPQARHCSP